MQRQPGPMFALSLASIALIGPLAIHIYLPLIPAVKAALGLTDSMAQLMFSIALFGMSFATLVWGALSDRYGRRPILLSGLALFLVGSLLCAAAGSVETLAIGRLVQAVGAGSGAALVRSIARDAYGPERLVKVIAYLTMFYTLGPMIAPIAGGMLIDTLGWRSVFGFSVVIGAVITLGAWTSIWETKPKTQAFGVSPGVVRDFISLFANLRFTCFVFQTAFNTGAFLVAASASSFLMKETLHRPATEFGFWFFLFPLGFFTGNFVSSRVGSRASNEAMVLTGATLGLLAVAVQSGLLAAGFLTPLAIFLPGFFITFSQGISLPYGQAGAMATIPRIAGTASGIGVFVQNLVGALFVQLYGVLADGTIWPMVFATGLSASLGLMCAVFAALARRRDLRSVKA